MAVRVAYDPAEQAIRRRRARVSQTEVGAQFLPTPISATAVSDYETGEKRLPFAYTPEEYEHALARALLKKRGQS